MALYAWAAPEPARILILGNSGSGKSTRAKGLAEASGLPHLDLDTLVWEPGRIAVPRPLDAVRADLEAFAGAHPGWIVEGCYGELIEALLPRCTELVFLNPGRDACLANNRRRPWEPHKYATPEAQETMFEGLQAWVAGYYERDDAWSLRAHRRLFDGFEGPKREETGPADR
ncbi:MAG: shikimate kinase [Holophagaceae bacterium]|nr:shikimate kinase [Holophagaceae bacterium]